MSEPKVEDFPVAPSLTDAVAHAMRDLIGLVEFQTCDHPLTINGEPIKEKAWFDYAKHVLLQVKACKSPQLVDRCTGT